MPATIHVPMEEFPSVQLADGEPVAPRTQLYLTSTLIVPLSAGEAELWFTYCGSTSDEVGQ